ncbi:MAG: serine/threonine protein kinase, partial [Planctomycetaceae bacterium]|nr:serine/threonine protein kinase [Planctomycetaceae bacterium]
MPSETCPSCGFSIPVDAPGGVCPNCVLDQVLSGTPAQLDRGAFAATSIDARAVLPPAPEHLKDLFPQLEIEGLLGHGGMGAVYRARQKKLDRCVALKIIRPEAARDPAFAERFAREARTLAHLDHPHIVGVNDFGEVDSPEPAADGTRVFYFIMEFVDGVNLRQLMQDGRVSPDLALTLIPQICDALKYAHEHGVVHRDIKP